MKNVVIILFILTALMLTSCKDDVRTNENLSPKPIIIEEPTNNIKDYEITEDIPVEQKPASVDEIIEYTNNLNLDTDIVGFSFDGILEGTNLSITADAGEEYQNSTAYLGDSVTMGLSFFENHRSDLVIAKGSINPLDAVDKKLIETVDGRMINFPTALSETNAKRAVLTFGSNAISIMSEETFLKYYIKLIDAIKEATPDCDIIIQSITPLATTCKLKKLTNELINRANLLLLVLAYSQDVYFLDSNKSLKDENGYLRLEYCSSDDGIHINENGYKIWINELRTHAIPNN